MIADPLNMLEALKARKEAMPYGELPNVSEQNIVDPNSQGNFALTRDNNRYLPDEVQDYHEGAQFRPEAVSMKGQMPFPDNHDPRMDFVNRWPQLPPSGILNDLKPQIDTGPQLIRKLPDNVMNIINSLRGTR